MNLFILPNLSATNVAEFVLKPGECPTFERLKFPSKELYREWCIHPDTEHSFICLKQGVAPGMRISQDNPPAWIYGLVAEYDHLGAVFCDPDVGKEEEQAAFKDLEARNYPPNYVSRTYSNNARLYWVFEKPLNYVNEVLWQEFQKIAFSKIRAKKMLPGFSAEESTKTAQYFEVGHHWRCVSRDPIKQSTIRGWLEQAGKKVDWGWEGCKIPIDAIRAECVKRWPGRWPGGWDKFDVGARGCRFWDPTAKDDTAVLVRAEGCTCFTDAEAWMPWGAILGWDFVHREQNDVVGRALNEVYYDVKAKSYWSKHSNLMWSEFSTEQMIKYLAKQGVSPIRDKHALLSDADAALVNVQQTKAIVGPKLFLYREEGIVLCHGLPYLNECQTQLMKPDPAPNPTGEGFPWFNQFWTAIFQEQRPRFLHWLAHYYRSCLAGDPERGLALFIAGPTSIGKSFIIQGVLSPIFGGFANIGKFLMGQDQFNEDLFHHGIAGVNDVATNTDSKTRTKFSDSIKSLVADDQLVIRRMFRAGANAEWKGRLIVTLNDDSASLMLLPTTDGSVMDKLLVLKGYPHTIKFPHDRVLAPELPFLCSYLRDMAMDPAIFVGGRFGLEGWAHPDLASESRENSRSTQLLNIIDSWRKFFFRDSPEGRGKDRWHGKPHDLLLLMQSENTYCNPALGLNVGSIQFSLNEAFRQGCPWVNKIRVGHDRDRQYEILAP